MTCNYNPCVYTCVYEEGIHSASRTEPRFFHQIKLFITFARVHWLKCFGLMSSSLPQSFPLQRNCIFALIGETAIQVLTEYQTSIRLNVASMQVYVPRVESNIFASNIHCLLFVHQCIIHEHQVGPLNHQLHLLRQVTLCDWWGLPPSQQMCHLALAFYSTT